ncbi:MAG: hypothetical protein PVG39_00255 [Desulfobacteraceae bacterium]|jgi:hypothetical protein
MSINLNPSGLDQSEVGDSNWVNTQNSNITYLNSTLLKLNSLGDVNVSSQQDFDGLQWGEGAGEWVNVPTI